MTPSEQERAREHARLDGRWEYIGQNCYRLKVPGGWLVCNNHHAGYEGGAASALLFIQDGAQIWPLT